MLYQIQPNGIARISLQSERDRIFENQISGDDNLGWIDLAIGGVSSFLPMIKGLFSACKPGQACGLKEIEAFVAQCLSTLDQIKQMLQLGLIAPGQAVSEAGRIAGSLSDPNVIYQAKKGKDAAALANGKTQAAAKLNEITQMAAQVNQQAVQAAANSSSDASLLGSVGISSSTLLLVGGGLLAVLLLKKNNAPANY